MSGLQCDPHEAPTGLGTDGETPDPTARIEALEARVAELEHEIEHLELAVESRTRIGTAIGLLAERHDTTTDLAWALMSKLSNHTNSKVHEVARLLVAVTDGTLDGDDVERVALLARHLPRAAAAVGIVERRQDPPRTRVVRVPPRRSQPPAPRMPPALDGDARP